MSLKPTPANVEFWASRKGKPSYFIDEIESDAHYGGNVDRIVLSDGRIIVIGDSCSESIGDGSIQIFQDAESEMNGALPIFDDCKGT